MVFAEGVDYSSTANDNWVSLAVTLKANGKRFAGRYAVYDKSPNGRGITRAEYEALKAHGVETFLYYEETEAWMLGGWAAGVRAAQNAIANIRAAGMPENTPVYYSHDIDPEPQHFAAIDACLNGAASVVGGECVGFYGGWLGIDHVAAAGTARWFCQTIAWEYGRGLHPGIHLHQYAFNQYFAGTNCDLVAAIQPHYGQAGDFDGTPTTPPVPEPPKPEPPAHPLKRIPGPDKISAQGHPLKHTKPNRFRAIQGGHFRTAPADDAPNGTPTPYKAGRTYTFDYQTVNGKWLFAKSGSWARAANFEQMAK